MDDARLGQFFFGRMPKQKYYGYTTLSGDDYYKYETDMDRVKEDLRSRIKKSAQETHLIPIMLRDDLEFMHEMVRLRVECLALVSSRLRDSEIFFEWVMRDSPQALQAVFVIYFTRRVLTTWRALGRCHCLSDQVVGLGFGRGISHSIHAGRFLRWVFPHTPQELDMCNREVRAWWVQYSQMVTRHWTIHARQHALREWGDLIALPPPHGYRWDMNSTDTPLRRYIRQRV